MKSTKNLLFSLIIALCCLCFALGIGLTMSTAKASVVKTIGSKDVSSFRMEYGASVRFRADDAEYKKGIRFTATLDDGQYESLQELDGVKYGVIIVPKDIVASVGALTVENLFGGSAKYCLDNVETCSCGKQHVANVSYTALADENANDGVKNLRGSLVDIKDENLTREFIGMAYISYNGEYVLAENAFDKTGENASVDNNTRSMAYVAQLAIEDGEDDESQTLYNSYVKKLESNQYAYTVNHFLPTGESTYDTVVERAGGTINTKVNAQHILKTNVDNVQSYSAYRMYEIDTTKGNTSGTLYANGKTVLNVYYKPIDTSLNGTIVNDTKYFLMGANNTTAAVEAGITTAWHDSIELGGQTKQEVVQITTTKVDAWLAGEIRFTLKQSEFEKAVANDWAYIKIRMYIDADSTLSKINLCSWDTEIVKDVNLREWVDVVIPLSALNQTTRTYVTTGQQTKTVFYEYSKFGRYGVDSGSASLLCTNSIKTGLNLADNSVTYYIDDISWGIDTTAPEISISGISSQMQEGEFNANNLTISITDDLTVKSTLDAYATKKLYKVVDSERTEITLTDGIAELTAGDYVFVVTADDRIYSDVKGNEAIKEVEFTVVEASPSLNKTISSDTTKYLIGAQKGQTGVTAQYHETISSLGGETKNGVVEIKTTEANAWLAGQFSLALDEEEFNTVYTEDWTYIKMHMYIAAEPSKINLATWDNPIIYDVETNKWVDVIVPLAKLNTGRSWAVSGGPKTRTEFLSSMSSNYGKATSTKGFLCTTSVKTGIGLTSTDVTYYIDDISWGKDEVAPTITVGAIASEMFVGEFTEPTVTVSDNIALNDGNNGIADIITKKLYKVEGDQRTEITLTSGKANLELGDYVYVVTADDRVYTDVAGNVATKEVEFSVVEKQDVVVRFNSAESANWVQSNTTKTYLVEPTSEYVASAADVSGLNANGLTLEGGAVAYSCSVEAATNVQYGAWIKFDLDDETLAQVADATAVTIRMAVSVSERSQWWAGVQLLDGATNGTKVATFDDNTWIDVTLTTSNMSKSLISYFDGTNSAFWLSSNTLAKNCVATYYINSITFDVTP